MKLGFIPGFANSKPHALILGKILLLVVNDICGWYVFLMSRSLVPLRFSDEFLVASVWRFLVKNVTNVFMLRLVDTKSIYLANDLQTSENGCISVLVFMQDPWYFEHWMEICVIKSNQKDVFKFYAHLERIYWVGIRQRAREKLSS